VAQMRSDGIKEGGRESWNGWTLSIFVIDQCLGDKICEEMYSLDTTVCSTKCK